MNTTAIKKMMIIQELSRIPDARLDSVKHYLDNVLREAQRPDPKNQSLQGIWKDAGFEKIVNLDEEIRSVRELK
jgi:hypothetical protein